MHYPDQLPDRIIHVSETDSTSDYLRRLSDRQDLPEFTTVSAGFQTAGKGQRGNSWESEPDENLLFSTLLYPTFIEAKYQFDVSRALSLAIKEVLEQYTHDISIKWPNDVYWKNRKICGILVENDLSGSKICRSIAGIGLNLNQNTFHSPAPNPVSLRQITGQHYDPAVVLEDFLNKFTALYEQMRLSGVQIIRSQYLLSLYRKTGWHTFSDVNGEFEAEISNVSPSGTFILTDRKNRMREYAFKEVSFILP